MGPQEDYIETVFTCEGDFDDPHLQDRLDDFQSSLKDLLLTDKNKLILKKVEPWNSVRVTFNIPREAAVRLKQLAQQGNTTLRGLGVLAVQILDQHISLTIAGRNNERTQLVFKTAETTAGSSMSVFDSQSPSLDVLRPPGPGPSNVEATRKNIQDYLRQGSSLIDSLFGQSDGDKVRPLGELMSRPNNIYPGHQGETFHSTNPATTSPSINAHSPSRSPVGASSLKFPQPPGLPPGLPFGPGNSLAGLPPPPPYPQGSTYMNNLQNLRFGSTSASPLLVNLLQNDPGLSSFLATGKIPPSFDPDALPPPKKKRKPRKPREKKPKPGSEGEVPIKSVPNPVLSSSVSQHSSSSPVYTQSVSVSRSETSCLNREMSSVESVKDHNSFQHPQAMHNNSVQNVRDDRVPLTCQLSMVNKTETEQENTAGKIINPVTGLLEPIENLSDTSPEKVSPKSFGPRRQSGKAGDIISNLITTHIRTDNQGNSNLGNQRTFSELSPGHRAAIGHISQRPDSSQFSGSTTSDSVEQKKQMHEAIRQEFINMIHKEKKDLKKSEKLGHHVLPPKGRDHTLVSEVKQTVPSLGHVPKVEKVSLPQESDVKSIPSQLLNKPLLEVKHNSVSKPTGSPDSNGDSECSSQGISVEPHLVQDSSSVNAVAHIDPHLKSYNNDSGVGSSSERSEDPSEPGDNDYKGTHSTSNSFDCAKSQLLDPLKQAPPNSKVMTVGYTTMTDLPKDLKNHKILSSYYKTNALVNSKIDPVNLKRDKSDHYINDQTIYNKNIKDHYHMVNNMEHAKSPLVSEAVNRKSPKLAANSPKPSVPGQDGQIKNQGNPENPPMQKKKYSPRNSPRGSPRPRSSNSPRNSGSPRASDLTTGGGGLRMPFLAAQDFASHLPVRNESQMVLQRNEQARSPYSEQRKSPFTQSSVPYSSPSLSRAHFAGLPGIDVENRRDLLHSGGVDMARVSPQCNNDNVAMFKPLEPYHHPHPQLRLSALAGTKDPVILQRKLEELRPIFQQLQQQAAQAQLAIPSATNGTDQPNSPSRSPVGTLQKGQNPTSAELHSAFDIAAVRSNVHYSVASTNAAFPNDNSVNCTSTRVSKISDEQKGTNVVSGTRRPSPGVANTVPFPYASSLPLPKRLTESVQKLVKPLPLDNSLPHQKSRSPSSSASTVKQGSSYNNSLPKAGVRGSASGNKTPVNDASHLDIDSITPSITGFCFDGHLDLLHPHFSSPSLNEDLGPPSLQLTDSTFSAGTLIGSASHASTTLVPAVTSSILSHKTYSNDSVSNSAFLPSNKLPGGGIISNSVPVPSAIPSANVSTTTSLCNSDVKMANLSAKERTVNVKPSLNTSGLGPPTLHPYNARYPVLKHEEKPKSPYQQMGLSEMLQETANLHSISTDRLVSQNTSVSQRNSLYSQLNISASSQEIHSSALDETTDLPIPILSRQNSNLSESKFVNCDSSVSISDIHSSEIPSISKIASMKSCGNINTTSTIHQPVPNNLGSKQTSSTVKEDVKLRNQPESGPVADRNTVSVSCESSTTIVAETSDSKALESVESEASQSKQDLSDSGQISKDCDNVTVDKTECDKVSVVPTLVNSADVVMSNLSSTSSATKPATTTTPNVSLHSDKENIKSELPENLETCDVSKSTKVKSRSHVSSDELHEDKSASNDLDSAPRQLRSRKRTNTGESDSSNPSEEPNKKTKLEFKSDTSSKVDSTVDSKITSASKISNYSAVSSSNEMKNLDDSNTQTLIDTVKSGLRARTVVKNVQSEEKEKDKEKTKTVAGKETRKEHKAVTKSVPEKKVEPPPKPEEIRRNSQSRRSRQSPSNLLEKPQITVGTRDKSPVRSRTRGRNSPVVVEQHEDTLENKRTTRSAKTKAEPQPVEPAPVNKRRRTSRDHR